MSGDWYYFNIFKKVGKSLKDAKFIAERESLRNTYRIKNKELSTLYMKNGTFVNSSNQTPVIYSILDEKNDSRRSAITHKFYEVDDYYSVERRNSISEQIIRLISNWDVLFKQNQVQISPFGGETAIEKPAWSLVPASEGGLSFTRMVSYRKIKMGTSVDDNYNQTLNLHITYPIDPLKDVAVIIKFEYYDERFYQLNSYDRDVKTKQNELLALMNRISNLVQ